MYCRRCGGIAEYTARKLASDRCKAPTATARRYLDRIAVGRHPTRDAFLSDTWDLTGEGTQNTAGNRAWRKEAEQTASMEHVEGDAEGQNVGPE